MTSDETVVLARTEYDALIDRNEELEDRLAALDADDGSRVPHAVALAIMRGKSPVLAFRNHLGVTLRELSDRTGIAASYLSEIERWAQARLCFVSGPNRRCAWHDDRRPGSGQKQVNRLTRSIHFLRQAIVPKSRSAPSAQRGPISISPAWWVLGRSPGVAPVWVAFSTTIWPLTATRSMPEG